MNSFQQNAVAGPSTARISVSPRPRSPAMAPPASNTLQDSLPPVFLPPPGPPRQQPSLLCTDDFLTRLHLLSAYDKFVRPYAASLDSTTDAVQPPMSPDKGKGKERDMPPTTPVAAPTPGPDQQDGDDEDGVGSKGEKKRKNTYKHLIKGVPGKHSMKKDSWLTDLMNNEPKQRVAIAPLDQRSAREAFTVSLEGLKGWNPSALIVESAQAREDRKKRKELKRLAKAQQLSSQNGTPVMLPMSPTVTSLPPPHSINVPAPQALRTGAPLSMPTPAASGAPTNSAAHTPLLSSTPRPGSTVPRPGSARPPGAQLPPQRAATPMAAVPSASILPPGGISMSQAGGQARGIKREREESTPGAVNGAPGHRNGFVNGTGAAGVGGYVHGAPGTGVNGVGAGIVANGGVANANANLPKAGVKAGIPGVRPRPVKKQRMDMQGQARDVAAVQQQPTPQGV